MGADEGVRNASSAYSLANPQRYRSQAARVDLAPIVTLTSVLTETVHPTWVFTEVVTPPGETTTVFTTTPQTSRSPSTEETFSSHSTTEDQMTSGAESISPASTPSTNVSSPTDSSTSSTSSPSASFASMSSIPMSQQVQGLVTPFASPASALSSESSALYINPWLLTSTTSSTTSSSTSSSTSTSSTTTSSETSDLTTSTTSTTSTGSEIPAMSSTSASSSSSDLSISAAAQSSIASIAIMTSATTSSSSASPSIKPSVYAGETPISNSLSLSHVTSQTSSSSPTSLLPGIIAGSETSSAQKSGNPINTKAIIGGTLGGAAFAAIVILALALFFRRRRQRKSQGQPTNDHQRILSNDSITSFHNRHSSQPVLSFTKEMSIAPLNFPRRYSNPPVPRWNAVPLGGPNANPFRDSLRLHDEERNIPEDPFAHPDDDHSPQFSPPVPTSRSVSNYSRMTSGGGHKSSMSYDSPMRSSHHQSSHYSGDSTLNLPNVDSPSFKYPITPKRRSDPFDLEPPPAAIQKQSPRSF